MKRVVLATLILFAATGVAAAQPSEEAPEQAASAPPSAASDAVPARPQEERKICRTEKATGSLTRRSRICMTPAQWREIHDNTQRGVSQLQGGASGGNQCIMNSMGACQGPETPGAVFN